jgi:hypothetical protein
MAYKFQLGSAILSGSTKFEEEVDAAGGLKLSGVDDTALDVSADSFLFRDADGTMKRDTMADYATAIAGDGLAASSGVLAVGVDDSSIEINSDALRIKAAGVTDAMLNDDVATGLAGVGLSAASGVLAVDASELSDAAVASGDKFVFHDATDDSTKKESIDDIATFMAGNGLAASSGVLAVGVDDSSIELNSDALRIKAAGVTDAMLNDDVAAGLAGVGLSAASGVMALDLNELTAEAVASGDFFAFVDSTDNGTHKETVDDLATLFAGNGLAASSAVLSVQVSGAVKIASDKVGLSGSIAGDGLKYLGGVDSISTLELDLNELPAAAVAVANDSIAIIDSDDNLSKKESIADLMTAVAGDGIAASSGVLAVGAETNGGIAVLSDGIKIDLAGLAAASVDVANDSIAILDAGDSSSKKESVADLMTAVAGNGLAAASGVLSLDASEVASAAIASGDHFIFHDVTDDSTKKETVDDLASFMAGVGLAAASGVLTLDIDEFGALGGATIDQADNFLVSDGGTEKKVTFSNLEDTIFGNVSGDATVAAGGALTIANDAVESGMLNDNVISGQTDIGAAVADTDELLISDGGSLRRTDVSRLRAMAVASKADGDTLVGGMNFFADLTSDATVTLPASPEVGDKVIVKAKGLTSATIIINKAGSQTIDGEASVTIESPYGAVTMVYVATNDWRLI